ncbi:MAG: bifunctional precorrin-2 dehydrogenase/sirohydrochlorin ferrochelatase [Deltaproteobacteria bacterium]|nr:bifunctional precorrin-2 dehydrogenase/sirohydrochlorin ferrochelatase [Deltaproteobacteria bacterium]
MKAYPVFFDLTQRPCVVIGGGVVAERKVAGLVEAGATVTIISPDLTRSLQRQAESGVVGYRARRYQSGDLSGFFLAFTATGDAHVDTLIFAEGRATGVLVNSADDPARCDFFLPAVIRRGDLAIAVSTGGSSPALARVMREELQAMVGEDYTLLMEIAAAVRREARSHSRVFTGDQWTSALKEPTFRQYVRAGQRDAAVVRLRMVLGLEEQ